MKILVFGAGALGSFIGGCLSTIHDVTLLGRKEHVRAVNRDGLRISGMSKLHIYPRAVERIRDERYDLIIITVKSYNTFKSAKQLKKFHIQSPLVLSMQNGLTNIEYLSKVLGKEGVIGGVTSHGVTFLDWGKVKHAGKGDTVIGSVTGKLKKETVKIAELLTSVGIETRVTDNIMGEIWAKVIVNSAINPLTAITGLKNGYLLEIKELEELLESVCREGIEVAKKSGITIPKCDIIEKTKFVASRTANNKSSMLQDIERGRRSEIEAINGAIVKEGLKCGVQTPMNRTLYALVKGLEMARV